MLLLELLLGPERVFVLVFSFNEVFVSVILSNNEGLKTKLVYLNVVFLRTLSELK